MIRLNSQYKDVTSRLNRMATGELFIINPTSFGERLITLGNCCSQPFLHEQKVCVESMNKVSLINVSKWRCWIQSRANSERRKAPGIWKKVKTKSVQRMHTNHERYSHLFSQPTPQTCILLNKQSLFW